MNQTIPISRRRKVASSMNLLHFRRLGGMAVAAGLLLGGCGKSSLPAGTASPPGTPTVAAGDTAGALVPAARTAIFPAEHAEGLLKAVCAVAPEGITGTWTPTEQDLSGVEQSLPDFLRAQNNPVNSWSSDYRQVAGVQRGTDRFLFLSYFVLTRRPPGDPQTDPATSPDGWKTTPYWVNDGGGWFFRVLYDVGQKKFVWYEGNHDENAPVPEQQP